MVGMFFLAGFYKRSASYSRSNFLISREKAFKRVSRSDLFEKTRKTNSTKKRFVQFSEVGAGF